MYQGTVDIQVQVPDFRALMLRAKEFDRALSTNLRREIRNAAKDMRDAMAAEAVAGSYEHETGMRQAVAAGLTVSILTGSARSAGVVIRATTGALPPGKKAMARAWNKQKWRHPVYVRGEDGLLHEDRSDWVDEEGHPYFGVTANRLLRPTQQRIFAAMLDAQRVMEG